MILKDRISVLMPTSPIPSHPSTAIIEETIASVRFHLPDSRIYLMIDGIRPEQHEVEERYVKYIERLIGKAIFQEKNCCVVPFLVHTHQAAMTRKMLEMVKSPLVLFVEHDTPLTRDYIDWDGISDAALTSIVNSVRFSHEAQILAEHEYLMGDALEACGVSLRRTRQFSARPHVARKDFYERLLSRFSEKANCFIEDYAHSICQHEPWESWKLSIYTPPGESIKRSYHIDGRAGAKKFDERQVF